MKHIQGQGRFQWNTGGWFGAQIGSTCWMFLLGSGLFFTEKFIAGTLIFTCFAFPNVFGFLIWKKRDRVKPYPALQVLVSLVGLFALLAMLTLDFTGGCDPFGNSGHFSKSNYAWLLMFPGMMAFFYLMERGSRK